MKMKRFFLCLCVCLLVALPAFASEAVLYVNGESITQDELAEQLRNAQTLNQQATDHLSEEEKEQRDQKLQQEALMALMSEKALTQEAKKRGLTMENENVRVKADQRYEAMIASVEGYVLSTYPSLSQEELDTQVDSLLASIGATRERYRHIAEEAAVLAALDEVLLQELPPPSEEEIQAYYDALYTEQKALFSTDENAFEAAMLQGQIVVHRPVTLKKIQKAEFLFADGAYALISQTAEINPDLAEQMRADQYAQVEQRVNAAVEALNRGEKAFEAVMEECREGSSGTVNYFHETSTRFQEEYHSRAAAFETVGEISTVYQMTNGYAILRYAGDVEACDQVPLAEVKERIAEQIADEQRADSLKQARTAIVTGAVITYPEGMNE